jgi:hypothetical protein
MSARAAIKGTFSDFKLLRTRSVCQLIIEIPIEEADAALKALGGLPRSDSERWCAVALLDMRTPDDQGASRDPVQKHHRAFCDLPMPQQAGIRSEDLDFQIFISKTPAGRESENAADAIRIFCGVGSRSEILPGTKAGERWIELLRSYEGRR